MIKFLLWCILLVLCWPLALLALVLYPLIWLLLLPFRLLGIAVDGVFELLRAILTLPARLLGGGRCPGSMVALRRCRDFRTCENRRQFVNSMEGSELTLPAPRILTWALESISPQRDRA